jgi:endonuclease YncB( thermonuclease family)
MRKLGLVALVLACSAALSGCPRRIGIDEDAGLPEVDSGYDPVAGNRFTGSVILDDERVRALDGASLRAGTSPCRAPLLARVYRIVDGDTVMIRGESAVVDAPLRMTGINTPEIAHPPQPAQCFGDQATTFTTQLLNRLVWVTFDAECFDPFDRLLGYVHVGAGEGDFWQRQLLRRGYATVLTVGGNRTYSGVFTADEQFANMSSAGLWSACF